MAFERRLLILALAALVLSAAYVAHFPPGGGKTSLAEAFIAERYNAKWLSEGQIGEVPPAARVEGVPWLARGGRLYSAVACLRMAALALGVNASWGYLELITGITYGAFAVPREGFLLFIPLGDPLEGLARASRFLGLTHATLVTNDPSAFVKACKYYISRGVPVIIPVNATVLYGREQPLGFILLIGYNGSEFYAYDPAVKVVGGPRTPLKFRSDHVARACRSFSSAFGLPWSYSLVVFERAGGRAADVREALRACGEMLVGGLVSGPFTLYLGSKAVEAAANYTLKGRVNVGQLIWALWAAVSYRAADAEYLRAEFGHDPAVRKAAELLEKASAAYAEALRLTSGGVTERGLKEIASYLLDAARYEREAGLLLLEAAG